VGNYGFDGLFDCGHSANNTEDMEPIRYSGDIECKSSSSLGMEIKLTLNIVCHRERDQITL